MLALVLLRIAIGWHFLYAGVWKYQNPEFSSSGFLEQAKGPFAETFHSLIPDFLGGERLSAAALEKIAPKMDSFVERFKKDHELSESQTRMADSVLAARQEQLKTWIKDHEADLDTYANELKRLKEAKADATHDIPNRQKHIASEQSKRLTESKAWLAELEGIEKSLRADLIGLLATDQRKSSDTVEASPGVFDRDRFIMFTNIAIGVCLIVGLFTRFASVCGAAFLALIVLAQPDWPGLYPPPPPAAGRTFFVNKEFIEMLALLALAATPVGRWGGLDFFVHHLLVKPIFRKDQNRK